MMKEAKSTKTRTGFRFRGVSITREGVYYFLVFVFILAGAMIRDFQLLMVLACMLLGPLLYNAWIVYRSLRYLTFSRKVPSLLSCGESFFVELTARNGAKHSIYALVVEDQLIQVAGVAPEPLQRVEIFFAKVAGRDQATSDYRAVIRKRGKYRLGPLTATTAFPLGMMRSTKSDNLVTNIVVMPRLGSMTPAWRKLIQLEKTGFASSRRRHGLLEGDFYGLREWRTGDPKQWIHWRSSAKQGELVVRQFEKQNQQDFVLVVDAWTPPQPTPEDNQRAERIISMAATAVRDLATIGGCQLRLVCCGNKTESIVGNVSQAFVVQAMTNLAVLVPAANHAIGETMTDVLRSSKPGSRIILLTSRDTEMSDTRLFAQVWNDPKLRGDMVRVKTVSAGRGEDADFFHLSADRETEESEA